MALTPKRTVKVKGHGSGWKWREEEAINFISSLSSDFYINLGNYTHYLTNEFNTNNLTLTDIISIAECATLNNMKENNSIASSINISELLGVVMHRLESDNPHVKQAKDALHSMECILSYSFVSVRPSSGTQFSPEG